MTALDLASLSWWETVADIGTWLVIVGVAGEGIEIVLKIIEHKSKHQGFKHWYEKYEFSIDVVGGIFWMMVVIGLLMEFRGSHESQRIVQTENTRITQEAGEAIKQAGFANERASSNELARLEMERLLLPIFFADAPTMASRLSIFSGTEAEVRFKSNDSNSRFSSSAITSVLKAAKWNVREVGNTNAEFSDFAVVALNVPQGPLNRVLLNEKLEAARAVQWELVTNSVPANFTKIFDDKLAPYKIVIRVPIKDGPGPDRMRREYFFKDVANKLRWPPPTNSPELTNWGTQ